MEVLNSVIALGRKDYLDLSLLVCVFRFTAGMRWDKVLVSAEHVV